MNFDQTASMGADCSGSILFAIYYATDKGAEDKSCDCRAQG